MDAVLELKHYSTERLLDLWEMTTTNSDHNIPAVRGWLMDEIERRFPEAFEKWLDIMRQAKQVPITGTDVPKVVELTGKHIGFGEKEGAGILSHLIAGGDLSLYGLSNAVTRFSQDVKSYDRATELEAAGYDVLTLSPAIWKSINEQAAVTV